MTTVVVSPHRSALIFSSSTARGHDYLTSRLIRHYKAIWLVYIIFMHCYIYIISLWCDLYLSFIDILLFHDVHLYIYCYIRIWCDVIWYSVLWCSSSIDCLYTVYYYIFFCYFKVICTLFENYINWNLKKIINFLLAGKNMERTWEMVYPKHEEPFTVSGHEK